MRLNLILVLAAAVFAIGMKGQVVSAADATSTTQSHEGHHPNAAAPAADAKKAPMGEMGGMMNGMDMEKMMKDCMGKHKDGKMCDHEMMMSCQKNMKKEDCMKMMDGAKKAAPKKK